jgi:peptidoglycan L-alanyl-D-glutamate endopeptidase CwlK
LVVATIAAYFFLVAFAAVLVAFPAYRSRVTALFWGALDAGAAPAQRFARGTWDALLASGRALSQGRRRVLAFVAGNRLLVSLTGLAFVLPTLIAWWFGGLTLFSFSDADQQLAVDRQIALLLEGEQLVPPAPLPPEAFTTREVEMVRPDAAYASRDWLRLDEEFRQRLLVVFKLMKERHGYEMVLIEGYRSPERQAQLAAQGSHVTHAGAYRSYHQYGLAADSAFLKDGRIVISERDPWAMRGYALYGEVAEQLGLTWGGRWKLLDYGHVELRRAGVLGRAPE